MTTGFQGASFDMRSGGGSNTTSSLAGGSSITRGGGSSGATIQFGIPGGSGTGSVNKLGAGAVFISGSANTLTPSSGGTTLTRPNSQTQPTGSGTTNSSGNTLPGFGSVTVNSGGTIQLGTIQGGTLVISGTFSRYVGLTLEAATALADSESRASRVVSIDGVRQVVTADWSPSRVNFFLVDGIVKLAIGG